MERVLPGLFNSQIFCYQSSFNPSLNQYAGTITQTYIIIVSEPHKPVLRADLATGKNRIFSFD
jgi:hypothetical protein